MTPLKERCGSRWSLVPVAKASDRQKGRSGKPAACMLPTALRSSRYVLGDQYYVPPANRNRFACLMLLLPAPIPLVIQRAVAVRHRSLHRLLCSEGDDAVDFALKFIGSLTRLPAKVTVAVANNRLATVYRPIIPTTHDVDCHQPPQRHGCDLPRISREAKIRSTNFSRFKRRLIELASFDGKQFNGRLTSYISPTLISFTSVLNKEYVLSSTQRVQSSKIT
jgi:hypothetical protein